MAEEDAALTRRFQDEHHAIRADIDQVRAAADGLGELGPAEAVAWSVACTGCSWTRSSPTRGRAGGALSGSRPPHRRPGPHRSHEQGARRDRPSDPAPRRLLDDIGPDGPDEEDIAELPRLLYGLHAILALHTAQEDESYLSLADDGAPALPAPIDQCRSPASRNTRWSLTR